MKHIFTRFPCCGRTLQESGDWQVTRTLAHCIRAVFKNPEKNIRLLWWICECMNEIEKRESIDEDALSARMKLLWETWDRGEDTA
jgi:hypothetical protein